MRRLLLALCLLLAGSASNAASIQTVDSVGDSFTINFDGSTRTAPALQGLTASATFSVKSWNYRNGKTIVSFDIVVDNTSNSQIWQSAVISAIGFDTDPNALSGRSSGVFSRFVTGGGFPTGAGFSVEYCACSGPGNTGLNMTNPNGTATVTMVFAGNPSQLDFSNFGIKWQALGSRRLGLNGASGVGVQTTPSTPPIPEPTAMAVFGLGALMVGAALRKRARQ